MGDSYHVKYQRIEKGDDRMNDVSKHFKRPTYVESAIAKRLIELEETPQQIAYFKENQTKLSDYSYWFLLSTCWVSYNGHTNIETWKELFSSDRPKRKASIMKPSELKRFEQLPAIVTIYRAHRHGERDWIAYTLTDSIAAGFAKDRNVTQFMEYKVNKRDILALFTRRGENEVIILDKTKITPVRVWNLGE